MRKVQKISLIAAAGLALAGLVLFGVGYAFGAMDNYSKQEWKLMSDSTLGLKDISETYENIDELEFDIQYCDITIKEGEQFAIQATGVPDALTSYVKDGKWQIKLDGKEGLKNILNQWEFFGEGERNGSIIVTLPKGVKLNSADLEIGAGEMIAEGLNTNNLEVSIGAGNGELRESSVDQADLECGMGTLTYEGRIGGKTSVNCGMGEILLQLDGKEKDYNYSVECGMGEVIIGEQEYGGIGVEQNAHHSDDSHTPLMEIECGMGTIKIQFSY